MNVAALRKTVKQEFYCAAIAFSVAGLIQLDTCGVNSTDEDVKIQSFSFSICAPEHTPDAFCTRKLR